MNLQLNETIAGFADFELDLRSGELLRDGRRVPLQDQPFRILTLLLERAPKLVSREELQSALWPGETFVDFNHGLNKAIAKLRDSIDLPDAPSSLIETFPRRGYRFSASVEWMDDETGPRDASAEIAAGASLVLVSNRQNRGSNLTHRRQGKLVLIAPDLLNSFPDSESVNQALRALKKIARSTTSRRQSRRVASAAQ